MINTPSVADLLAAFDEEQTPALRTPAFTFVKRLDVRRVAIGDRNGVRVIDWPLDAPAVFNAPITQRRWRGRRA